MSDPNLYPQAFLPIRDRIRAVVTVLLNNERKKAVEVGLPGTVFADGALDTLLELAADVACSIVFPAEDPDDGERPARAARVHRGLAQTCTAILSQEHGGQEYR